ncbi:DUF1566 domain-containing protein [Alteromonas sp. C1M14]|uniref:Lcl C-terminal domain-containing protein n=1 Tax=Alteromonas sp. C1M14 TaxID=2841567 RepID=UPI001C090A1C|nr:DUF1566 domain-containing protein [Alteromonas sp. C1M14]MBU2977793.1 DUF1566 domain-containing protein [Alteromonas sp. C1M14]
MHLKHTLSIQSGLILLLLTTLVACGGGSDSADEGNASNAVYVNAGDDIQVLEATDVAISGDATGETDTLIWHWSASPQATITHDDTSVSDAIFTAPAVTVDTTYVLTLTATNSTGNSDTDTLNVVVKPVNITPVADITVEQEDGQAINTFSAGGAVVLSGSASTDEDAPDEANPISAWEWQQTTGSSVLNNVTTDAPILLLVMPVESEGQQLTFELTVTDAEGATNTASVTLNVLSESETLPTVYAGSDQSLFSGERIILEGDADTTVTAGLPLTARWVPSSSAANTIVDDEALSTYAVAPQVTEETLLTYTLAVADNFDHLVYDEVEVWVYPFPIPLMNDTGVTVQANDNAYTNSQQNAYPGQDGQRGGDIVNEAGLLEKAGRGKAGFDFTKLNSNGDEEDDTSQAWSCVRDNITGLIWEKKTEDGGLHDDGHLYSWYFTDENGGLAGTLNGADSLCTLTNCNTQAYVTAANSAGLCGFYDWRMPSHEELMSIVHFGLASGTLIDDTYFPFLGTPDSDGRLWYWTSIPSADGVSGDAAQNAWALDFATGLDNFLIKSSANRVRLVRAGR